MKKYTPVALPDGPPSPAEVTDLVERAEAACLRATEWIIALQADDGGLGDPGHGFKYYRGPWALALMGRRAEALALCHWIRRNLLVDGRLDGDVRILTDGWAYRDSVLMVGAHMLGQYDLSLGLVDSLLEWQDPESGGFANDALDLRSPVAGDEMDLPYAAGPGLALLATGRLEPARRVADFLALVLDAQTAPDERFYGFWSRRNRRLIIENDATFDERMVIDLQADRMQRWTFGGISAAFLCRLFLADPRVEYLEVARRYQALSMGATPAQLHYPSACKTSWGAATLLQITGEDQYWRWCAQMTEWYVRNQEPDGWWHPWIENTTADVIEITLEFIQHLDLLASTMRSGSTPPR